MRVHLLACSGQISPFGRTVDELGVGATTFGGHRRELLTGLGLPEAEPTSLDDELTGPALVLTDEMFLSRRALGGFLKNARRLPRARLALPPSRLTQLFLPLQDLDEAADGRLGFDVAWLGPGESARVSDLFALEEAHWVSPPYREWEIEAPVPPHIFGRPEAFTFPLTSTVAFRVRHWVHVLRVSHLVPQVTLLDRAYRWPPGSLLRALLALRFSKPATLSALKRRFVYRGKRVFVHPSATVEASVLHDDVVVGPHAYVVGSVLGPGTYVEDRAHVNQSCLGPRTFVSCNSTVSASAVFGNTDACINGMQACVVDEECGLTSFARPLDIVPGGEVKVIDGGRPRGVGEMPCGVAFGRGVFVGADVVISPGREIPPGVRLVADPGVALRKIDADVVPGTTGTVREGSFVELAPPPVTSTTKP